MLYFLSTWRDLYSPLNVFQYITFRSGGAFLTALGLCLLFGGPLIGYLRRLKMEQFIREYGPQSHLKKAGTPTMGGLLILGAILVATLLWARPDNRFVLLVLASLLYLGVIGFIDDYRKWLSKHPAGGLSENVKMASQVLLGLAIGCYFYFDPPNGAFAQRISIPYLKGVSINLGGLSVALSLMVLVGSSNAVNLTDGLDGLAPGTLLVSALSFSLFSYLAGNAKLADYLRLVHVPGAGELTVFLAAMGGACLGFLWFNAPPAEVFMGDTGSLPLGGALGVVALSVKQELLLVIIGGIFVLEALSVLLQVGSVRLRKGRRIFRMAPLHHHFEVGGMPETKVTIRFWIVAMVLSLVALTSLKIR
ncbi:MAG: phospho-N-acetylmuramoyl-pentapeptide-transferase [Elusimicrobia bacterium]|nr:phospho-N-acetylmuramoyl-pentapeptide-transferase [Elusimicrobiota bacterium]